MHFGGVTDEHKKMITQINALYIVCTTLITYKLSRKIIKAPFFFNLVWLINFLTICFII